MNKMKIKFVLLVITMILTLLTLSASTYAWFEMNSRVSINDITINVMEESNITVSVDGINYKETLTYSDLYYAFFCKGLSSITTDDGRNFTTIDGGDSKTSDLVEFNLYFKLDEVIKPSTRYAIYLTNYNDKLSYQDIYNGIENGTSIKSEGVLFENTIDFLYDYIDNEEIYWKAGFYNAYQSEAMRFSFTYESINSDLETTIFDLSDNPLRGYNYRPNSQFPEREYGSVAYINQMYPSLKVHTDKTGYKTTTRDNFSKFVDDKNVRYALDNNSLVCILSSTDNEHYYGMTTVRIWLEGWDADCFDSILSDKTEIQLEFCYGNIFKI